MFKNIKEVLSMKNSWSLNSWRTLPIKHQPIYGNGDHLKNVEQKLNSLPPLVFAGEARNLKERLAKVKVYEGILWEEEGQGEDQEGQQEEAEEG